MNAHVPATIPAVPGALASEYINETPITVSAKLNAAIAFYDNCCDRFRELAVEAILSGRSAFWTTASHHSARAYELPVHINKGASIVEALEQEYPSHPQGKRLAALDTLIPLNLKAATALSIAYEDFGTWRDEAELLARAAASDRAYRLAKEGV